MRLFHNQGPLIQAKKSSGFIVKKMGRRVWARFTSEALSVTAAQEAVHSLGHGKGFGGTQFLHVAVAVQVGPTDEVQAGAVGRTGMGAKRLFHAQGPVDLLMWPRKLCPCRLSS